MGRFPTTGRDPGCAERSRHGGWNKNKHQNEKKKEKKKGDTWHCPRRAGRAGSRSAEALLPSEQEILMKF